MENETGYEPGHPWYYKLGGTVLKPKEILEAVKLSGYQGYNADEIKKADNKAEPERSSSLRSHRQSALKDLHIDITRYRELACQLRDYRKMETAEQIAQPICSDIHTNISLKISHIYNEFAHLVYIDDLLSQQLGLFD